VIPKKKMSKGRRCVKSNRVFNIKRNRVFREILVACWYSQVPGIDFTGSYAPIINNLSFRIQRQKSLILKQFSFTVI
jgi:hypothetical protein